jgi:molybdenum cofactor cytidylyltransferase
VIFYVSEKHIAGIVLAAGLSSRMGQPKMLLPWKDSTVIDQLLRTVSKSPITDFVVVTGFHAEEIQKIALKNHFRSVFNPDFGNGSMLISLQTGLNELMGENEAFFLILGDQPFLRAQLLQEMVEFYSQGSQSIIIPSFNMKRGHPWLIDMKLKNEILELKEPHTLRDFLLTHEKSINYCVVKDANILEDMDTPEDYKRLYSTYGSI